MIIDLIVDKNSNTKHIILRPELEAEKFQLERLCFFLKLDYQYKNLKIEIKNFENNYE